MNLSVIVVILVAMIPIFFSYSVYKLHKKIDWLIEQVKR